MLLIRMMIPFGGPRLPWFTALTRRATSADPCEPSKFATVKKLNVWTWLVLPATLGSLARQGRVRQGKPRCTSDMWAMMSPFCLFLQTMY